MNETEWAVLIHGVVVLFCFGIAIVGIANDRKNKH
jgi:hypothetical protein